MIWNDPSASTFVTANATCSTSVRRSPRARRSRRAISNTRAPLRLHRTGRSGSAGPTIAINRSTSAGVTRVPAKIVAGPGAVVTMPRRRCSEPAAGVVAEPLEHPHQHRTSGPPAAPSGLSAVSVVEPHVATAQISQGRCREASRMPRPMMILAGEFNRDSRCPLSAGKTSPSR